MRKFFLLLISFLWLSASAQIKNQPPHSQKHIFVSSETYKILKKDKTRKIDSVGSRVINNETLIQIAGYEESKGVKVLYEEKDSTFLEIYKELVYNKSKQNALNKEKQPTMKIWKDEIKVYFDSTVTYSNKRQMIKFFKYLDDEIDSLKISVVNRKEKSNYFVYFINKPTDINWDTRISDNDGCYLSWNGNQRLYNCTMKLNTQVVFNEKQQLSKLKKHFIWSLGNFYYQNGRECKSFLSSCNSEEKELTKEDLEILKYHYSYGICKGTPLENFEKQHKDAKASLKKDPNSKYYFTHLDQ